MKAAPSPRAILTVVAMAAVFGAQQGLTYPLLALLLEDRGHARSMIGLNAAMLPLGLIVAAPLIGPVTRRIGAVAMTLGCCGLLVAALGLLASTDALAVWFVARFLLGMGINGLYVASETWLNTMVPAAQRGRWLAVYATAVAGGFALGPALLLVTGTAGIAPFAASVALVAGTAALILTSRSRLPAIAEGATPSLWAFLPLAPLLLLAVAGAAAFDQAVLTFLPLYVLGLGAGEAAATLAVTALALGNVLLQWPIGWLADRGSRRIAMLACTGSSLLCALVLPVIEAPGPLLWLLVFVWGGLAYGTYTVALVELGDRFQGGLLLAGNAAFALMWGVAGLVGPAASGAAMDALGGRGLPLVIAVLFAVLTAAFVTRRAPLDSPAPIP